MNATLVRLSRLAGDLGREPDGRLLDAFLAGSQPAFRELVHRHGPVVFAVCHRVLRHQQDAEDAFQAVFLVLARRAADVWPRDAVGSWLHGVAHRVAMKARTTRARRQGRQRPLEDVAGPTAGPEPDTAEVIDRAVRRLPEVYRAAVVACDLEGLSRADAAARLGWKEGTLSGRLARARQLLAARLRQVGLTLPAGGLAAVLGTDAPLRADLIEMTVSVAIGTAAAGVPAPVAVLAEGVVPGMFALKLKAAALLVACSIGFGAWAAGPGDNPGQGQPAAPASPGPLAAQPAGGPRPAAPPAGPASPERRVLEPLQGQWRVVGITVGQKEEPIADRADHPDFEITGNTLYMPYRDASTGWRRVPYTIIVDPKQNPATIDLVSSGKPVGRGIYEFTAKATTCANCHESPMKERVGPVADLVVCEPAQKTATGLRLALGAGGRPTKFGGSESVVEFRLERVVADDEVRKLERQKARLEAFLAAIGAARDDAHRTELERLERQLAVAKLKREEELARQSVEEARSRVEVARAQLAQAQAIAEQTKLTLEVLTQRLKEAQDKLAVAEKAAAASKQPPPVAGAKDGEVFTVHVRPQLTPEKVIRVKATGKETVLEGLAYAAEDMAISATAVSVWIVRDKTVLPVDLVGITMKGDATTNYVLKPGDRLFVQVRPGK